MKRLLSVILIAAMVFTFVPAAFATGGETEPEEIIIEFSDKTVFKADGTKFTAATSGVTKENYKTDPACFEIVDEESHYTRKLTIVKSRNNTTQTDHMLCLFYVFRHKGNDATAIADRYGEFAIKTPRLKAGKYSVKIKAAKTSNAGEFEVYVNGTDIGSFNALDTTATGYATSFEFLEKDLGDVEVTPDGDGYTKISFKNKATNNSYSYLPVYQIIFIPEGAEFEEPVEPDVPEEPEEPEEPEYVGDPVPVEIVFSDTTIKSSNVSGFVINNPSYWDTTGFEVDLNNTYSATYNRLQWTVSGTSNKFLHFSSNNNWVANQKTKPGQNLGVFTIKTKELKAPGYYNVKLLGVKNTAGVDSYVYVNGQYAGLFDFHDAEATLGSTNPYEDKQLNTIYIKPDKDGYVTVKIAAADNAGSYMDIYRLSFIPADVTAEKPLEYADIEMDFPKEIYQGESGELSAYAKMSDGSAYHMAYYTADAAEIENPDSISAKADGSGLSIEKTNGEVKADGVFEGTITANELGEQTFTVSVKIGEETYEKQGTVLVKARPKLSIVGLTYDKTLLPMMRTANPTLTLVRDDGNPCTDESTVIWESSDVAVAAVSEDGIVTGTGIGTAVIRATVTTQNATAWGEATVTVTEAPVLEKFELTASSSVMPGTTADISLKAFTDDGEEASTDDYEIIYSSTDNEVLTVTQDGVITGVKDGEAVVIATARNENGKDIIGRLAVTVYKTIPAITIDFTQTETKPDNTAFPTKTPGYTIVEEKSTGSTHRKFEYSDTGRSLLHVATGNRLWPASKDLTKCAFVISVNVPFESDYNLSLTGGKWFAGGIYSIYIDDIYVGDHSFWSGTLDETTKSYTDEERFLNTVHLTADEHEISFRTVEAPRSAVYVLLDTLKLTPVVGETVPERVEAEIPEELAVGETFSSVAQSFMSDGTPHHFGLSSEGVIDSNNAFSIECESDALGIDFTSYETGKSGSHPYTLTGVSTGEEIEVRFVATVKGEKAVKTGKISVKNDPIVKTGASCEAKELFCGDSTYLIAEPELASGRITSSEAVVTTYRSLTPRIATVDGNLLTTVGEGEAVIEITSTFNEKTVTGSLKVNVQPAGFTSVGATAGGSEYIRYTGDEDDRIPLLATATDNLGNSLDTKDAEISAIALTPEIADLDERLNITPKYADEANGSEALFEVTVKLDGRIRTQTVALKSVLGKSRASYMTAAEALAARENVKKYSWAKSEAEKYVKLADVYTDKIDKLYDMISSEGIPRGYGVGGVDDPEMYYCRYCAVDLRLEHGSYSWVHSPLTREWKIQCPDCKRLFPSNDFGSFYKLGLNEYGEFDRLRALSRHHALVKHGDAYAECDCKAPTDEWVNEWYEYYGYGDKNGYLYNKLYENLEGEKTINVNKGLRDGERRETWGVDDGFGYVPRKPDGTPYTYENTEIIERHTYIAEYLHFGIWYGGMISDAIEHSAYAYFYTGDMKYGRVAAILLDRVADFYPDFDISIYGTSVANSHGGYYRGKILGNIWERFVVSPLAISYDMVFDVYEKDSFVREYLREKSKSIRMDYSKETASQIRTNIEDGILRTSLDALVTCDISGNFGYPQLVNAKAAVVLDTMPETKKWIDYLMAPGWSKTPPCNGGGINAQLMDEVDADGQGNEASAYNVDWHVSLMDLQTVLDDYDRYKGASLYNNPKFVKMFYSNISLIAGYYTPQIGDSSSTAGKGHWVKNGQMLTGFEKIKDPVFAQVLYMLNGNKSTGLHYAITVNDPERLADEVQDVIDEHGMFNPKSQMLTSFGFGILHDGGDYTGSNSQTAKDTRRNIWMFFGSPATSHAHSDALNLGMTAFGLNFMPDLGYPEETGTQPNRLQWVSNTISHNTVLVNEKEQLLSAEDRGRPQHFDSGSDDENVRLIDVSVPYAYKEAQEYRRSVMMIRVDDENSYAVDFFRILGGDTHTYSFHASSDEISDTTALNLIPQTDEKGNYVGSYAGKDAPYGKDPNTTSDGKFQSKYPFGFTWLRNVDRDSNPGDKFEIDFAIKDFNKAIADSKGLKLHMTMLNGGNDKESCEVATADGLPPQKAENDNIDKLKYVLVKNSGENLDTTFTTVFEPYRNSRYIKSVDELEMTVSRGTIKTEDAHRALRIEHMNGRVDYVFYATNNAVTYSVTDGEKTLYFRGFAGVYRVQNGVNTYRYVHDGDIIGEETGVSGVIDATVVSFTQEHSFNNEIVVVPHTPITDEMVSALSGKYVFVDNGVYPRSGAFGIKSAELLKNGNIRLDIGDVTPIRRYINSSIPENGYEYVIAVGQAARIPLTYSENFAPVFDEISKKITVSAGSTINLPLNAISPDTNNNLTVTYDGTLLPRGAYIDQNTGDITWKPDSSQIGNNHFAVTARDDFGRETTIHFTVTVYGSTGGTTGNTGNSGNAGNTGNTGNTSESNNNAGDGVPETPDTPDEEVRFTDLHDHAWAADSINALADEGIIKGTSENTFSPVSNITRADFAILLVRAFEKESDNTENFDDVLPTDYFAKELAIARNTGLVQGIGDNKYAPKSFIKRCDMMLIIYRVLSSGDNNLVGNGVYDVPQYPDFEDVPEYAREAVSALVGAGLVNGKNNLIAPNDNTTRAEVAVLLKRILDYTK